MKLGVKAKRNIGLIAITLVIIIAIILTVYFVQKSDDGSKLKYGHAGQVISTSQADVCVKSMQKVQSAGGLTAADGKCLLILEIELKAGKKLALSSDAIEVKDGKDLTATADGEDFLKGAVTLKKGQSKTFALLYEVEDNRVASYYLYICGARVDLGGTVTAQI